MNRVQRRKNKTKGTPFMPRQKPVVAEAQPDFSGVPLATVCQSIQLLINELYRRGFKVYDFDNKKKFVQQVRIIRGKVYFLAAEEVTSHEKDL